MHTCTIHVQRRSHGYNFKIFYLPKFITSNILRALSSPAVATRNPSALVVMETILPK